MRFKQYLTELTNIETGQAIQAHEPTGEGSIAITNPKIRMEINYRLVNELYEPFLSPEAGIQKIRKVLHRHGLDLPALYDANPEGDEIVIEVDQFGDPLGDNVFSVTNWDAYNTTPDDDDEDGKKDIQYSVYVLYYLTDEGHYEFYAEVGDENRMEELTSDEEIDEEE
jgi:hypothetical protein